jgi:4-hydroxy-3-polyprenylbenzoate decarboxylase
VVVVDDDVDPWDRDEVLWALTTRVHPPRDIEVVDRCLGGADSVQGIPWNGTIPEGDSQFNARLVVDATISWEHREEFPEVASMDADRRERLSEEWPDLLAGLDG